MVWKWKRLLALARLLMEGRACLAFSDTVVGFFARRREELPAPDLVAWIEKYWVGGECVDEAQATLVRRRGAAQSTLVVRGNEPQANNPARSALEHLRRSAIEEDKFALEDEDNDDWFAHRRHW